MYQTIEQPIATIIEFRGKGIEVARLSSWDYSYDNATLVIYEGPKELKIKGVNQEEYLHFLQVLSMAGVTVVSYNPATRQIARSDGVKAVMDFNQVQLEAEAARKDQEAAQKVAGEKKNETDK